MNKFKMIALAAIFVAAPAMANPAIVVDAECSKKSDCDKTKAADAQPALQNNAASTPAETANNLPMAVDNALDTAAENA